MRYLTILFCALLLTACSQKEDIILTGSVTAGDGYALSAIMLKGSDTTVNLQADSSGRFRLRMKARPVPFFTFYGEIGKPGDRDSRRQLYTPLYLAAGDETVLEIRVSAREGSVRPSDAGNRALQNFQQELGHVLHGIWDSLPAPEQLRQRLTALLDAAGKAGRAPGVPPDVREYLRVWSQLEFRNIADGIGIRYYHSGQKLPEDLFDGLMTVPEMLDRPCWRSFNNSFYIILSYIQRLERTPEGQLAVLEKTFTQPDIRKEVAAQIVELFLMNAAYNNGNLERLEKMSAGMEGRQEMIGQFRNRRHSVPGAPAPGSVFEDREGKTHRLADFQGKYLYIDLWASWCRPCCAEIPHLQELEKKLRNKEVVFISISLDRNRGDWEKKLEDLGLHGNQWITTGDEFPEMLNVRGIPHFILYDKEGRLLEYSAPRPSAEGTLDRLESLR